MKSILKCIRLYLMSHFIDVSRFMKIGRGVENMGIKEELFVGKVLEKPFLDFVGISYIKMAYLLEVYKEGGYKEGKDYFIIIRNAHTGEITITVADRTLLGVIISMSDDTNLEKLISVGEYRKENFISEPQLEYFKKWLKDRKTIKPYILADGIC